MSDGPPWLVQVIVVVTGIAAFPALQARIHADLGARGNALTWPDRPTGRMGLNKLRLMP